MLDDRRDNAYNIILSIFVGVFVVLAVHNLYDSPRIIIVESNTPNTDTKAETKCFNPE